jgi:hypothetical protein
VDDYIVVVVVSQSTNESKLIDGQNRLGRFLFFQPKQLQVQ